MAIRKRTLRIRPVGADGSAVAAGVFGIHRPGFVRALSIDYQNQPVTTDIVLKADSSAGATIFTRTSSATDIAATPVAMPGIDEGGAATAATDVGSGGFPFANDVYYSVAEGDGQTTGDEIIVLSLWLET